VSKICELINTLENNYLTISKVPVYPIHQLLDKAKEGRLENELHMITVFFKHDQAKNLDEIQTYLKESGFWREFPPQGIEIVSWYVMMGLGHVVTIKVPASRLREVNIIIEKRAWKAFTTDFYPTYNFMPFYREFHEDAIKKDHPE
jgi:hypothetical protein